MALFHLRILLLATFWGAHENQGLSRFGRAPFRWITRDSIADQMNELTPLLFEGDKAMYICRGWRQGNWIPGKFYMNNGNHICQIPNGEREIDSSSNYQVLYTPPRSVYWGNWTGELPYNAVAVGTDPMHGVMTFVGKGTLDNGIHVLGKILYDVCYTPIAGRVVEHRMFEVLLVSLSGRQVLNATYVP